MLGLGYSGLGEGCESVQDWGELCGSMQQGRA
jgi:hypothetical protein